VSLETGATTWLPHVHILQRVDRPACLPASHRHQKTAETGSVIDGWKIEQTTEKNSLHHTHVGLKAHKGQIKDIRSIFVNSVIQIIRNPLLMLQLG